MTDLSLKKDTIENVKKDISEIIHKKMDADLAAIILYGSCAKGDYTEDSDIDFALLLNCDRMESKKYNDLLASISTEMAMKYYAIVNFVCFPYEEFLQKKVWYPYFANIDSEGEVLNG